MSTKKTRNKPKEQEIILHVFTNVPQDEAGYQTLRMFYQGAVDNSIGMARCLNNETGETELLLVGLERSADGGLNYYPLAKCFDSKADVEKYFSPDLRGGWFDPAEGPAPELVVDPE